MLKLVLHGSATLAAGIAAYFLLVHVPLGQLEAEKARHAAMQEEYLQRQKQSINLPLHRAQASVMQDVDKAARMALPDFDGLGAGARDLEDSIREAARERKLASRLEISTGDWSSRDFYYFRPFTVRVNAEFRQAVEFLQAVSTGSVQLRTIRSASLRPVAGRDEVMLTLEALAIRYRPEERK